MENYQNYPPYPDSGNSSPRSREIDFENTSPWEDNPTQPQNYKVKFLCSYGGKIQPRSHDNQLSYVGGDTKIFAVDRNIKFNSMQAKLSALIDQEYVTFKYQLPGEDLDALISVTNDDDLEHMMHEYDRMFKGCAKPARMRLFLFPLSVQKDAHAVVEKHVGAASAAVQNNVDFLFGLERGGMPPAAAVGVGQAHVVGKMHDPVPEPVVPDDRSIGSDHEANTLELQRELQRMQFGGGGGREQGMYRRKSEDNSVGGYPGEYYMQKMPEKMPPASVPPPSYWPEKQVPGGGGFPPAVTSMPPGMPEPSVYMIPGPVPGMVYQTPAHPGMMRPMTGQTSQGFYAMQRMGSGSDSGLGPNIYRDQPVYNLVQPTQPPPPTASPPVTMPPQQQQPRMAAYTEGIAIGRTNSSGSSGGGVIPDIGGYAHVGYDSAGRQVFYQPAGGMVAPPPPQPQQPYQGMAGAGTDVRTSGVMSQEAKTVTKVTQ